MRSLSRWVPSRATTTLIHEVDIDDIPEMTGFWLQNAFWFRAIDGLVKLSPKDCQRIRTAQNYEALKRWAKKKLA